MGSFHSSILLMHGSLSHCGYMKDGPRSVVQALLEWTSGQLAMPAHTYCYPDPHGNVPVFDPHETPSVIGTISDYFWRQPGVVRSLHPTHSVAALGKGSEVLCEGHELCNTPCGRGTPYEKFIQQDASVLMFGVTMNVYTLFYTAADAAGVPHLYEEKPCNLCYQDKSGEVKTLVMKRQNMQIPRCFTEMGDWLFNQGLLKKQKLGQGMLLYIPSAAEVHSRLLKELAKTPLFLVREDARNAIASRYGL